jgi:hypothetical protein
MLIARLRRSGVTEVAIERGGGVLVGALLAAGLSVVVVSLCCAETLHRV